MSRVFAITSSTSTVVLDGSGRGSVTFTVTNTSSDALRMRVRLVAEGATQASWLTVSGEEQRRLEADGTEQFSVELAVPPGSSSGRHSFRFDAVSVENPDDDTVEGPSVAFEIAAAPTKKPFPWWIAALVGVLAVALAIGAYIYSQPPEIGEKCSGECAGDLVCGPSHVCEGPAGFKGCRGDEQCVAGLLCQNAVCVGLHGSECGASFECAKGLTCSPDGRCVGIAGSDGCAGDGQCAAGLQCQDGVCLGAPGAPCGSKSECARRLICEDQVCLGGRGFRPCTDDGQCSGRLVCFSGSCKAYRDPVDTSGPCDSVVNGKIPWNAAGNTSWAPRDVRSLCGDNPSTEPVSCFHRAMFGGVERGDRTPWLWRDAHKLCSRTSDSGATILCFQRRIAAGDSVETAIEACRQPDA